MPDYLTGPPPEQQGRGLGFYIASALQGAAGNPSWGADVRQRDQHDFSRAYEKWLREEDAAKKAKAEREAQEQLLNMAASGVKQQLKSSLVQTPPGMPGMQPGMGNLPAMANTAVQGASVDNMFQQEMNLRPANTPAGMMEQMRGAAQDVMGQVTAQREPPTKDEVRMVWNRAYNAANGDPFKAHEMLDPDTQFLVMHHGIFNVYEESKKLEKEMAEEQAKAQKAEKERIEKLEASLDKEIKDRYDDINKEWEKAFRDKEHGTPSAKYAAAAKIDKWRKMGITTAADLKKLTASPLSVIFDPDTRGQFDELKEKYLQDATPTERAYYEGGLNTNDTQPQQQQATPQQGSGGQMGMQQPEAAREPALPEEEKLMLQQKTQAFVEYINSQPPEEQDEAAMKGYLDLKADLKAGKIDQAAFDYIMFLLGW